mgnify:CR=1 FL=1
MPRSRDPKILTTSAGAPVADNQNSLTAGRPGPVLLQDVHLIEKLAHQNRERIPVDPDYGEGVAEARTKAGRSG